MSVRVSVILDRKGADVVTAGPDTTVGAALELLVEYDIGALVVLDAGGGVAGIVSERDVVRHLARAGCDTLSLPVADVMTRDVIACTPDATADEVMHTMTERRLRHLPVLGEDGRMTGLVSIGDVVKSHIDDLEIQTQSLQQYITGSPL